MSGKKGSGKIIDLRKRKPGGTGSLPFNWGASRTARAKPARHSPLRAKRRRTRAIFALGIFTILVVVAYGVNWISYLPRLTIASVGVVGAEDISPRLVKAYFESELFDGTRAFFSRYNIFLFPRDTLEERLMEHFPHIRSAEISRDALLAQAVIVTLEEREPRGRWCDVGRCYYLDDKGFIFAPAPGSDPTLYTFTGVLADGNSPIGQTFLPERFPKVLELLLKLKDAGFASVGLSLESEEDFSIPLARGYAIRAPLAGDFEKIVHDLELVLSSDALRGKESQLEYIDLRFGNRVYYKFKNSEAASIE